MATQNFRVKNGLEVGIGATILVAESGGNIGINSTSPTAKLDVNGDVAIASTVSIGTTIDIIPYNNLGMLSFEGSAGQLFSITNNLTSGSIFSVNDTSGIPSIDVDADGTIQLAPYGSTEYVGIGTTNPTAKLDVNGTLNVSGVSTFQGNVFLGDNDILNIGNSEDLKIYHSSNTSFIRDTGAGNLNIDSVSGSVNIRVNSNESAVVANQDGSVELYYDAVKKFETTNDGAIVTGILTATSFYGDGTNLTLTDSVALGGDTTGDYVESITGTSNQITVTGGTGEGSTPTLSIPNQFTIPQDAIVTRDLTVQRDLYVDGSVTIGGTSATIFAQTLQVSDADLILGVRTDGSGNDVSTDNTANHGGIAVASTEGNPLVDLYVAGIETVPSTYKKIMWFKAGTFSGLGTDAWLSNYAVGIGSTQFPTGTRLAAGNVQITENDISVVRDINASGIVTANSLSVTSTANISGITTITDDLELTRGSSTTSLTRNLVVGGARNSAANDFATLQFKNYDSNGSAVDYVAAEIKGSVPTAANNGGELVFLTAADGATSQTERLRITSDGDVGIGIDNPEAKLDINPGYGTTYTGTFTAPYSYTPTTGEIRIGSDSVGAANTGDYVGLRFSIIGNGSGNGNAGIFAVREQAEGNGKTSLAFATRNWGGNSDLTEKVRITSDGYLGIGTTNPQANFVVSNSGNNGIEIDPENSSGTNRILSYNRITGQRTKLEFDVSEIFVTDNQTEYLRLNSTGLGIGTDAPSQKLDVNGALRLRGALYDGNNQAGSSGQVLSSTATGIDWVDAAPANAIAGISIYDETSLVGTANSVSTLYFVGPNVTATAAGSAATITVADYVSNSGIATNLKGGTAGDIPYQTAADTTAFLADPGAGGNGYMLSWDNANTRPTWAPAAPAAAITGLSVRDEGSLQGSANSVTTLDIVGDNVSAAVGSGIATITVSDTPTFDSLNVTGDVSIADKIVHTGDTDTAIRFPAADTFTVETAGSERIRVDSSGNVGIGTDSPGAKLDVNGDIYVGDKIAGRQNPTTSFLDLDDDNNPGVLGQGGNNYVTLGSVSGLNLIFDTNNNDNNGLVIGSGSNNTAAATKHMVVSGVGDVGIGTDNPSEKLDVRGHIKVDNGPVLEASSLQTSTALKISNTYGYIEIGPQNSAYGHIYTDRDQFYFNKRLVINTGTIASYDSDLIFQTDQAGGATERLRIKTSNGYVGINSTSPTATLDVNGTLNVSGVSTFTTTVEIKPNSNIKALIVDSTSATTDNNPNVTLRGNGPQVIDFRDSSNGNGLKLAYRTNPNQLLVENSENTTTHFLVDRDDGRVELSYGGSKKFETTSYGIYVTGTGNTSTIAGAANLVLDPTTVGDNTGTVIIKGDLQVDGTQTVINSTTMSVDDLNITLADGAANASAADGAGLTVDGANATLTYFSTPDSWEFNKDLILDTTDATLKIKAGGVGTRGGVDFTFVTDSTVYGSLELDYDQRGSEGLWLNTGSYPVTIESASSQYIKFRSGTTEHMRITSAGDVGIGTVTPASNARLHIVDDGNVGGIALGNAQNVEAATLYANWNSLQIAADQYIYLRPANTTAVTLNPSGNVGIGTDSPAAKLDIRDGDIELSDTGYSRTPKISFTALSGSRYTFAEIKADENSNFNGSLIFSTKPSTGGAGGSLVEAMRIDPDGNLGVGATNPTNPLTINGDGSTPILGLRSGNASTTFDNGAQIAFGYNNTDEYQHFIHTRHNSANTNNAIDFYVCDGTQNNTVTSGSIHTMSLLSGYVGINSTTPTEKLDVVGTVKATDFNTTSDQNLKTNIQTIEDPLEKIVQIRGVNFEWKENNKPSAGVIAQEVEKVLPQLVTDSGTKTVNYNGLIGLLIEAVKAQQEEINMLKERLK